MTVRPFIDFYTQLNVIPTNQDIGDLQAHFQRRGALYRQLGIPPLLLKGRSILEFGPGSGHNALFTASLLPGRYVLVDGNPSSVESTRRILKNAAEHVPIEIVHTDILTFQSEEKFDAVFCEGLIPTQLDPGNFLRHVATFIRPGGVLVITCVDSISVLSEVLRRYLGFYVADLKLPVLERLPLLVSFLKPHFMALPGMSRRHEDWVIDSILHPWSGPLLSIPEAIETLHRTYTTLGTSPHLLTDWRWYKKITKEAVFDTEPALSSYWANVHSFIDHREVLPPRPPQKNVELAALTDRIYANIFAAEKALDTYPPSALANDLEQVIATIDLPHALCTLALAELIDVLRSLQPGAPIPDLPLFCACWGRGQQYISFINEQWVVST